MTRSRRIGVLAAAAVVAGSGLVGVAPSAGAAPPDRDRYHDVFSDTFDGCPGMDATIDVDIVGSYVLGNRGQGGFARLTEHRHGTVVYTNLATGGTFTEVFRVNSNDLRVVDNGDGTLTITVLATGSDKYYDRSGKLVLANPGQVRFQLLVDHAGTPTDPSDDVFLADLGLIKGSTGRNDTDGRDFCADFAVFTA